MDSAPLISICIPAYNGANFIRATIQSVLNQSFTKFELVVSDDRSLDGTLAVVRGFKDPRIRLIENDKNLGLGGNWNRVLSSVLGKYVKLLCDDDLLHPRCLEKQVGILEAPGNQPAVLTVCNRNVINHRNEVVLKKRRPLASGLVGGRKLICRSIRRGTNLIGEPAVGLFRRDALKKKEMVDPRNPFLSDLSLWSELLRTGDAFVDPECLASFRISENATSAKIGLKQAACFRAFGWQLYRDPFYRLPLTDLISACLLSLPLCLLRNGLIRARTVTRSNNQPLPPPDTPPGKDAFKAFDHDSHSGCGCGTVPNDCHVTCF
jgi:glycosyltransferase involved in cell wall biosynthesis